MRITKDVLLLRALFSIELFGYKGFFSPYPTYVNLLIEGFEEGNYDNVSKAEIFQAINEIHSFARKNKMKSSHYELIFFKLEKLLNNN